MFFKNFEGDINVLILLFTFSRSYIKFSADNIADALINAHKRGILIWGISDTKQAQEPYESPIIQKLQQAGIFIETQKHPDGIMHIKAIVTDKAYAIGSYNWTESATVANDEILEIGYDKELHNKYLNILKKVLITNQ